MSMINLTHAVQPFVHDIMDITHVYDNCPVFLLVRCTAVLLVQLRILEVVENMYCRAVCTLVYSCIL